MPPTRPTNAHRLRKRAPPRPTSTHAHRTDDQEATLEPGSRACTTRGAPSSSVTEYRSAGVNVEDAGDVSLRALLAEWAPPTHNPPRFTHPLLDGLEPPPAALVVPLAVCR